MAPRTGTDGGRAATGVSIALALAVVLSAHVAPAADCLEGISDENARKLFDGLAKGRQPDGCELDEVATDHAHIQIRWKKEWQVLDPVLVAPSSCVPAPTVKGPVLSTMVPPFVSDECGAEVRALGALVQTGAFGALVPLVGSTKVPDRATARVWTRFTHHVPYGVRGLAIGGLAIVGGAVGGAVAWRRRRSRRQAAGAGRDTAGGPKASDGG